MMPYAARNGAQNDSSLSSRLAACLLALVLMAMMLSASGAAAQAMHATGQHPQPAATAGGYAYQLFLPRGVFADKTERRWPLVIFLHGSGERGDDIAKVKLNGPPKIADASPNFPFVLISPQLPAGKDWDISALGQLLDYALKALPVDEDRVYLTGLSLGGDAAWRWAAAEPERFAALAPVAGSGDVGRACALRDLPLWAFHGDKDDVVPPEGSFAMVRAVQGCGNKRARLTIYPGTGHNSWERAYDDPALYLWLLSQQNGAAHASGK